MEMPRSLYLILILCAFSPGTLALEVTPSSHCATYCLDSPGGNAFKASDSSTNISDISCQDIDYSTTDSGIKFRKCLDCLQTSKKVSNDESDLKWYIYNLRYTLTTCLYAVPEKPSNGTVASQCNIDKACKSLKAPLTHDGVKPSPNSTWDYCTANDGTFMGSSLSSCISCLQSSTGDVYLSNFMIALQAGCNEDPQDGTVLSLSGSVFSTNAVNNTDPESKSKDNNSSGSLPPSAIAGIVIGCVFLFVLALALLTIHFRREKTQDAWDRAKYYSGGPGPFGSYNYHGQGNDHNMSQAYRRYYTGNAFGDKPSPAQGSAGEYYDNMHSQFRLGKQYPKYCEKSESSGSSTTYAAADGQAGHRTTSRSRSNGKHSPTRSPSPRVGRARERRSNTPDSFAVQQYLQAAEDSARLADQHHHHQQQRQRQQNLQQQHIQPLPSVAEQHKPRSGFASKIPSLTLPSLTKLRSKKGHQISQISPPLSINPGMQQAYEMQISGPIKREDTRFHDRPLGERVVYATERPPSPQPQEVYYDGYLEVPLRSGKSTLYG